LTVTPSRLAAARALLDTQARHRRESVLRRELETLLRAFDCGTLETGHPRGGGFAGACLSNHRLILGRKGRPKAENAEKHRAQLDRHALADAPAPIPQRPSEYGLSAVRQGAAIVPHALLKAGVILRHARRKENREIETTPRRRSPRREVSPQRGAAPADWVRPVASSDNVLPFHLREPLAEYRVPIAADGALESDPAQACSFWAALDREHGKRRDLGKNTPKTLLAHIDCQPKLTTQLELLRWGYFRSVLL